MIRITCVLRKPECHDTLLAIQTAIATSKFGIVADVIGRQGLTLVRGQWVAQPFDAELAEFVASLKDRVGLINVEFE